MKGEHARVGMGAKLIWEILTVSPDDVPEFLSSTLQVFRESGEIKIVIWDGVGRRGPIVPLENDTGVRDLAKALLNSCRKRKKYKSKAAKARG